MYVPLEFILGAGLLIALLAAFAVFKRGDRRGDLFDAPKGVFRTSPTLAPEVERKVRGLLSDGRKIDAIKLVRNSTALDLKKAKELVERLA